MSNPAVSLLLRRMIEDMTTRHFAAKTQADSIRIIRMVAAFHSPDQAEPEDLRRFQLHMAAQGASPATMNAAVSALRFFFHVTLGRVGFGDRVATVPSPERLPVVLSPKEVAPPAWLSAQRDVTERRSRVSACRCSTECSPYRSAPGSILRSSPTDCGSGSTCRCPARAKPQGHNELV